MIGFFFNSFKIFPFLILFIGIGLSISFVHSINKDSFITYSNNSFQKDTRLKKVFNEMTGDSVSIENLGKLRIIETDGTIKKDVTLKEIHSYWIIYEKDGSLHDFLISAIDRIEIGDQKNRAVFFDEKGKASIKWIP